MDEQLVKAVIKQLGYTKPTKECKETMRDICRHGIDGGYGDFVYYADTVKFFDKNRDLILEYAQSLASDLGEDMLTMIANFNCLKHYKLTATQIMNAIYGETEDTTNVKNALAWFAGEEVSRHLTDN